MWRLRFLPVAMESVKVHLSPHFVHMKMMSAKAPPKGGAPSPHGQHCGVAGEEAVPTEDGAADDDDAERPVAGAAIAGHSASKTNPSPLGLAKMARIVPIRSDHWPTMRMLTSVMNLMDQIIPGGNWK